jgi:hypothetical protein
MFSPAGAHVGGTVGHLWKKHIRPRADGRYVRAAQIRTGFTSCAAGAFQEHFKSMDYSMSEGRRYMTSPGNGAFSCSPALPHGATIKVVRFTVHDASPTEWVTCGLERDGLVSGAWALLGEANTTPAGVEGTTRLSVTSLVSPKVDNQAFAYRLVCHIVGSGTDVGFYGASIEYTLRSAQGAAS